MQKGPPFHILLFYRSLQNRTRLKGPSFQFFFGIVRLFFQKFFNVSKESPFRVFWYFATEYMSIMPKGSPLLLFSALCDIFWKKKYSKTKKKFLRFLSLRYSADFRRSRLVQFCRQLQLVTWINNPSLDCLDFLHAAWKHACYFSQNMENSGTCMETLYRITIQPPLFELEPKTFPILRPCDHFVFTSKFLKLVPYVIIVSQIALLWIWRSLKRIMCLKFVCIESAVKLMKVSAAFEIRTAS